ncbi:hypothetical protein EYF80_024111 [Liparis tanakae]|uniref:Uncharacterized protein n=1 Tax=Liparis tanakae TaxID=230148 RepID=A0A4Z2HIV4_9TELE|nr:hypothetical protein EYF80_024111 [Liparis tanakae]
MSVTVICSSEEENFNTLFEKQSRLPEEEIRGGEKRLRTGRSNWIKTSTVQARLVQQEGAAGPRSRQVALGRDHGNSTQPGSRRVNQARLLMAFQGA